MSWDWLNSADARPMAQERRGPVQVGWMLSEQKSGIVYFEPERVRSADMNKTHAKSASRCPAVINMESRYFVIRCPFDLHLRFARDKEGRPAVVNVHGDSSPVRRKKLAEMIHVTNEREWRYPDRPTVQVSLPYLFIADEPVYMTQTPPFMHYLASPWPGTLFGGRFPINVWPRPLMWAFEWRDTKTDLVLKRGDPWFYALFETSPQDRPVQLVESEKTEALERYMAQISGAVNFVNQTFSLFKTAEARRPERLVEPVKR